MVKLPSGQTESWRAKCFDYSDKVILSIKYYIARRQWEIERVKWLKCGPSWIKDSRIPGTLYENDSVYELSGIGPAMENNVLDHGMEILWDLLSF